MAANRSDSKNPKTKPNYLYSVISVALLLFLLGLFGIMALHASNLSSYIKESIQILVEIKDSTKESTQLQFQKKLEGSQFAKARSVRFISKEEAAQKLGSEFDQDMLNFGINPLFDAIVFNVKADYMEPDSLEAMEALLKSEDLVADVYFEKDLVNLITANLRKVAIILLGAGILFVFITIMLINNTIKLALYSNRFMIKTMQLVGASRSYIRKPYLMKSLINGMSSAFLAILGLIGLLFMLQNFIPELSMLWDWKSFLLLCGILLVFGMGLSWASTLRGVTRYLRAGLEDLY